MAFYIEPPFGNISLSNLECYAKKRLDFLLKVAACHGSVVKMKDVVEGCSTVSDSDCLIEGTKKDSLSHFILR